MHIIRRWEKGDENKARNTEEGKMGRKREREGVLEREKEKRSRCRKAR